MFSSKPDATIVVLGLSPHTKTASLDLRVQEPHELSKRGWVKRFYLFVGADRHVACVHTVPGYSNRGVRDTFAVVHQPLISVSPCNWQYVHGASLPSETVNLSGFFG